MSVSSNDTDDSEISADSWELERIAKKHKIRETMWCTDFVEMASPHPFTAMYITSHCRCNGDRAALIRGPTWLHIWKAVESYYKKVGCDHRFIEGFEQKGGYVEVSLGS